ncbi:MAG: hypothetical protein R2713_14555 [Ilumatobacteraceae bacterium]
MLFERFPQPELISTTSTWTSTATGHRRSTTRPSAGTAGDHYVAQIITFGTIKARNAVRDAPVCSGSLTASATRSRRAMPPLVMGRDTPAQVPLRGEPQVRRRLRAAAQDPGDVRHRPR